MRSTGRIGGVGTRGRRDECPSADRREAAARESYMRRGQRGEGGRVQDPEVETADPGGKRKKAMSKTTTTTTTTTTATTRRKKKRRKTRSYSVCPGGTERVASVFVGNESRGRTKGWPPSRHPSATHGYRWWLCCRRARRWDGCEAVLS